MVFPKGRSDNFAILKCSIANGIPIIVKLNNIPKNKCPKQVAKPPNINQKIFITKDKHPLDSGFSLT